MRQAETLRLKDPNRIGRGREIKGANVAGSPRNQRKSDANADCCKPSVHDPDRLGMSCAKHMFKLISSAGLLEVA
jgi:hypothetical protein